MVGSREKTKCQYLCNRALNKKTKATFIPPTLKVEGTNVCSDLYIEEH